MEESMSLKKIALIAVVVVVMLSSVIVFGCKPKTKEAQVDSLAAPIDTMMIDTTTVVQ